MLADHLWKTYVLRYNRNSFLPSVNQTLGIYCDGCVENWQREKDLDGIRIQT